MSESCRGEAHVHRCQEPSDTTRRDAAVAHVICDRFLCERCSICEFSASHSRPRWRTAGASSVIIGEPSTCAQLLFSRHVLRRFRRYVGTFSSRRSAAKRVSRSSEEIRRGRAHGFQVSGCSVLEHSFEINHSQVWTSRHAACALKSMRDQWCLDAGEGQRHVLG